MRNITHCWLPYNHPDIKQLLDEVEHDIMKLLSKPRSLLSAEAEGRGR